MRNLKRALSLALASIMVLGMMVVGAGAVSYDEFSDKESIVNQEAVSTLVELNVINGKEDGNFDPTGIITRAEMAKLICVVLNGGNDPNLGTVANYTYSDTVGNWAAGYIEYCTQLGIIAGDGAGKFNPNNTVTGSEAAKMLLAAVGYQPTIEGYVGANWATATNVRASNIGLYDGLSINPDEGLTRDSAAQMVFNALDAYVVTYKYTLTTDGSTISSIPELVERNSANQHVTMLEDKFKAMKVEAIVIANEEASLSALSYKATTDKGDTTIALAENSKGQAGTYILSTGKDLLGESVYLYIKYKDERSIVRDAIVIGSPIPTEKNKIVESTDGTSLGDLLDDNNLDATTGTVYMANFGGTYGDGTTIYGDFDGNKSADRDATPTRMTRAEFEAYCDTVGVTIKLIDNNDDGRLDYALAEKYSFGVVNKYDTANEKIRVQGSFLNDDYKFENVVGIDDVAAGDLVLFTEFGGKLYLQKPEYTEAKLEAFSTSKQNVKIDGETIKWSGLYGSVDATYDVERVGEYVKGAGILNTSAAYYKDVNGYIFAVGEADDSQFSYAILLSYENQTKGTSGALGKTARAKLLLSDGTTRTYEVSTINGKKVTDCGDPKLAVGSEIGFNPANVYDVYSYVVNDGVVRLTSKTDRDITGANGTGVRYEKGQATIFLRVPASTKADSTETVSYTVTKNTVFLYQADDGKVYRYVGTDAPSIKTDGVDGYLTGVAVSLKANSRGEALVVFVNAKPVNAFEDKFLYAYKQKVSENGDAYEVDGILDGVIGTYNVSSAKLANGGEAIEESWYTDDSGNNVYGHRINMAGIGGASESSDSKGRTSGLGLYQYLKEDDGTYSIQKVSSDEFMKAGVVQAIGSTYIRMNNNSYTRTDETKLFYARKDKTAEENVTVSRGDQMVLVVNEDNEIVYGFVTMWSGDIGSGVAPSANHTVTFSTAAYNNYKFYVNGTEITDFTAGVGTSSFSVKSTDNVAVSGSAFLGGDPTKTYTVGGSVTGSISAAGVLTFKATENVTMDNPGTIFGSGSTSDYDIDTTGVSASVLGADYADGKLTLKIDANSHADGTYAEVTYLISDGKGTTTGNKTERLLVKDGIATLEVAFTPKSNASKITVNTLTLSSDVYYPVAYTYGTGVTGAEGSDTVVKSGSSVEFKINAPKNAATVTVVYTYKVGNAAVSGDQTVNTSGSSANNYTLADGVITVKSAAITATDSVVINVKSVVANTSAIPVSYDGDVDGTKTNDKTLAGGGAAINFHVIPPANAEDATVKYIITGIAGNTNGAIVSKDSDTDFKVTTDSVTPASGVDEIKITIVSVEAKTAAYDMAEVEETVIASSGNPLNNLPAVDPAKVLESGKVLMPDGTVMFNVGTELAGKASTSARIVKITIPGASEADTVAVNGVSAAFDGTDADGAYIYVIVGNKTTTFTVTVTHSGTATNYNFSNTPWD